MVYYSINSYFIVHSSGVRSLSRGRSRAVYCVDSTHQDSVEGRGCSSSLHVSKNSGAGIKAESVSYQLDTNKSSSLFSILSA